MNVVDGENVHEGDRDHVEVSVELKVDVKVGVRDAEWLTNGVEDGVALAVGVGVWSWEKDGLGVREKEGEGLGEKLGDGVGVLVSGGLMSAACDGCARNLETNPIKPLS